MATQEMLIAGLRTQREELDALILRLSEKKILGRQDCSAYDEATRKIEQNLRMLRKLTDSQ